MTPHNREELLARLNGRLIVASISAGKDSAATRLYMRELGIPDEQIRNVFMNTGWESEITYEYLRGDLTEAIGPIAEISADKKVPCPHCGGANTKWCDLCGGSGELERMAAYAVWKGMFPSKQRRWCTDLLKVQPMARYLRDLMDAGTDVVSAVGIRAAESEARSRMPEWEWSETMDCEVWRPILSWTLQDVVDIHTRHGLRPNPLYLLGAERVGCWPCIYSRKAEIRLVADMDPGRIKRLRVLEDRVTERGREIVEARGETLEHPRTFFQPKVGDLTGTWPIDRAVEWSRTKHGGRQVELFASTPGDAGCMRWGLCDTNGEKADE